VRGSFEWIEMTRRGGQVKRCHTMRTLKEQNNGEHSFGVAMLAISLCESNVKLLDHKLLAAALMHDLHEQQFGDTPAPVKWMNDYSNVLEDAERQFDLDNHLYVELSEKQKEVLFWADKMEYMFHCLEEMRLGNRDQSVLGGFDRSVGRLVNMAPPTQEAKDMLTSLQGEYNGLKK